MKHQRVRISTLHRLFTNVYAWTSETLVDCAITALHFGNPAPVLRRQARSTLDVNCACAGGHMPDMQIATFESIYSHMAPDGESRML